MAEIILGRFLVDLVKLLVSEVHSWKRSKRDAVLVAAAYVAEISEKLHSYASRLRELPEKELTMRASLWESGAAVGFQNEEMAMGEALEERHELERILSHLGYTLKGLVDDKILDEMIFSFTRQR